MRYLICILVLALAVPAMGDSDGLSLCPSKSLAVDSDFDLPASTNWYSVNNCDRVDYTFDFVRTSRISGRTIIHLYIDGTDVERPVDSALYPHPGPVTLLGSGIVESSPNRLRIEVDRVYATLGHFVDMLFKAWYYNL